MEKLLKTLDKLEKLLKNLQGKGIVASPTVPKVPKPKAPKLPDPSNFKGPQSTKDPVKVAEQIQNPDDKLDAVKEAVKNKGKLNINSTGQWSLKKADMPTAQHVQSTTYGPESNLDIHGMGNIGHTADKKHVVRHGLPAMRTSAEYTMAGLLGAQHMMPHSTHDKSIHHPEHEGKPTFSPIKHSGTSFQDYIDGDSLSQAHEKGNLGGMREQWKKGDLHRLWALHYISNNGDMHEGNFKVNNNGVKAFDSDMAFYELPKGHIYDKNDVGPLDMKKMFNDVPAYLTPFIHGAKNESTGDGIDAVHKDDQPDHDRIRRFAKGIEPELFKMFGDHAVGRAQEVKEALSQENPTEAMQRLWKKQ